MSSTKGHAGRLALVIGGGLALGAAVATATRRTTSTTGTAASTAATGTGGGGLIKLPGGGVVIPKPVPVVTVPKAGAVAVPAGPVWPSSSTPAGKSSGDVYALAAHIAKRRPLSLPYRAERVELAAALIKVSAAEAYPLDLLIGHAIAEGGGRLCMTPTASSGAYGPLQTTRDCCAAVNVAYPPRDVVTALTVAVRYMRHLNRTYSEAATLTSALRCYGMGVGNYRKFLAAGCAGASQVKISVWRAECSATSYTGKIATETGQAAAFHTLPLSWWMR